MKIFVKAKPNAKEEKVERIDGSNFLVCVKEPPVQGKASAAIVEAIADYFDVPKSSVKIISGHTARQKVVEIL